MEEYKTLDNQGRKNGNSRFYYREGRLYFDRKLERNVYFVMTIIIMLWSILAKLGLLS